ncbi:putative non-specific serine/threonine protein kinase [Helianthus annuus]|uniref:Non-specific serine/threonine protein kinase n=1 Tax=Helianthus annuus TaxID=4232 RepID=A0A251U4N4_HELAN|nr:receptor-like protein EIX1 [Helianthus annuus]KAF5794293.1 putative non-specific serine/threonine protein kinase [Helianthus annuus]KAJ0537987.1 putative non-specific serine/threonine protein kinase [Helianthus annuus]KAJ0545706.1 putative non-specific serine/threonine protein kinase [Helianthus annuus]KAJ0552575.1 putative non-specific serine/threonine protein kinase [Helianthus annuus]KAJ0718270.1 putative non-specific serine/threonine protein kinase [Helianthus annuus]
MGNHWVWGLHLVLLSIFLVATKYTCLGAQNSTRSCHERERLALLQFKDSIKDDFKMLSSWIGSDCCSWNGVRCDGANRRVAGLHLRGNYADFDSYKEDYYLEGDMLNAYLAELRHLQHLDLSGNNFQRSRIPKFFGSFKQLSYLNLSNAGFSGVIPHHIGNLSNLKVLDLGSNDMRMPDDMAWVSGLSSLEHLDLTYVNLSQANNVDMAWVSGLSSLEHLDLSYVNLSQANNVDMVFYMIPSLTYLSLHECGLTNADLGLHLNSSKILPNIEHLDLSSNHFKGQLPHFFQNLTSLTFLDLSFNNLSLAWNSVNLLNMIPSLSELHLSRCGLHNAPFSPTYLNSSAHSNLQYFDLSGNSVEGRFPYELVNITSLKVLDLSSNSLNSSIPVMPNLLKLDVSFNNFEHIKLVGIWRQCHLKELSLSYNHFGGEMIGPSSNTSECSHYALEVLESSGNELNGSIPESVGKLNNLRVLHLSINSFTGSIPKALERLRYLEELDLLHNKLTGPVPTFLGNLTKLDLSDNQFSGSIPESLGRLTGLTLLSLESNQLTGPIPESLGRLTGLTRLSLESNQLTGPIPESLGKLTSLTDLYLQSNQLTGQIPESLGRLTGLTDLNLQSNLLTGPIPVTVGQLTKLVDLDVSKNSLEGVVMEAHFANLSMLQSLDISSNHKLIINISHEWIPPFQLWSVGLGSCKILNGFPHWLQNQRMLVILELSNASLYGLPPTWLQNMPMLDYLDLSHNKLIGSLINLPFSEDTRFLSLQDNLFNGSIPRSMCRRRLVILDVSRNRLSGNIPDCLENLQEMRMLMLGSNGLSGVVPSSLGNITYLAWLKLNDNKFNGQIPQDLGKLRYLEGLDLGNNEFSGNMPKWIGEKLSELRILRLHKNNFTGGIPHSLCKCSNLHILDIAHNNLTGSIPHCFGELSGMVEARDEDYRQSYESIDVIDVKQVMKGIELEYTKTKNLVANMDLSSNKLTGEIPVELTALASLMGLNLSHNHLNGSIPDSIGNMKALNSLDLSDNQLRGTIPPSMAALNFLSWMNLSHNNLSGRIPTGNQLQTLTDPSMYAGNRDLCGAPLPNNCSNHENPPATRSKNKHKNANEPKNVWFYLDITCGFATGFWGIIGVLAFKKQWRRKIFMIAEVTMDKVYVVVAVKISKIKRGREA